MSLDQFKSTMGGFGVFWARSMPSFFDDFLNKLKILRYPKWVDMEFIYYPLPLDRTSDLILNFNLNFHGKIQWTSQFYGEAGFGFKVYNFEDGRVNKKLGFGLAYGTVGLGYNF